MPDTPTPERVAQIVRVAPEILRVLSPDHADQGPLTTALLERYFEAAKAHLATPWSTITARIATRLAGATLFNAEYMLGPADTIRLVNVRVLHVAHALACGDPAGLSRPEVETIRRWVPDAWPDLPARAATDRIEVSAPFRALRPRAQSPHDVHLARCVGEVRSAAGIDHPVVASLKRHDGSKLDLRRAPDGTLLRPVLSPGGEPMDMTEFADVAARAPAWVDSPFHGPTYVCGMVVGPATLAVDLPARSTAHAAQADLAAQGAMTVMVGLVAIDGVVHRPTQPPILHLTCPGLPVHGLVRRMPGEVSWRLPDGLKRHTCLDTWRRAATDHRPSWMGEIAPTFGIGDAGLMAEVVGRWFAAQDEDEARTYPLDLAPTFEILDADAFPADRDAPLRALVSWHQAFGLGQFGRTGGDTRMAAQSVLDGVAQPDLVIPPLPEPASGRNARKGTHYFDPMPLGEALVDVANAELERRRSLDSVEFLSFTP